jgi:hypothetical protein
LGIPTVRDRVAQMAVLLVIEPIFEADFEACSFGFRPRRNAHQALDQVQAALKAGRWEVYDADLASYFDTIDHGRLMQQLERRIADRSVLRLIRLWLRCPVVEDDDHGSRRTTHPRQGTPQGGVISPLLANIYLHDFDRAFHATDGPAQFANARLVRYADDFVVLARWMGPRLLAWLEQTLEQDLGLTVNRTQTSRGAYERAGCVPGLSGLHAPLRPRPARAGPTVSERRPIDAGAGAPAGETARLDLGVGKDVVVRHDCRGQSAASRMDGVFPIRVPARGLPLPQSLPAGPLPVLSAESESTAPSSVSWS